MLTEKMTKVHEYKTEDFTLFIYQGDNGTHYEIEKNGCEYEKEWCVDEGNINFHLGDLIVSLEEYVDEKQAKEDEGRAMGFIK